MERKDVWILIRIKGGIRIRIKVKSRIGNTPNKGDTGLYCAFKYKPYNGRIKR
jgi:hypothetical protein